MEAHFYLSTKFKTVSSYGLQAITTSVTSRELLLLYVQDMRPKLLTADGDRLFVCLEGNPVRVGRCVTDFFKRVSHLNLCTTTIRSIVATETSMLSISGEITPEQTKSSISMGGHSAVTCAKFYQKRNRELDVFHSQEVHQKLIKSPQRGVIEEEQAIVSSSGELSPALPVRSIGSVDTNFGIVATSLMTPASNIQYGAKKLEQWVFFFFLRFV